MPEENKRIAIAFYEKLINEFDPEGASTIWRQELYATYLSDRPYPDMNRQLLIIRGQVGSSVDGFLKMDWGS
jgi:hypothetical protein